MEHLIVDPKNREEQLYYPPSDYIISSDTILPQEDEHFIDETITSSINYISNEHKNKKKSNCGLSNYNKIIRKDIFLFTLGLQSFIN